MKFEDLKKEIDRHEIISFDLFDTLIMRKTLIPHDVFRIVDKKIIKEKFKIEDFFNVRIMAEQNLISKIPNIYELFDEIQRISGISDNLKKKLVSLELKVEREVLTVRKEMFQVLEYVKNSGKKMYCISDMYIPKKILKKWLKEFNLLYFEEMFVSCEYHKPKVNGLYDIFKDAVKGESYLHIGDSVIYDGEYAKKAGMDTFIIKSSLEMFRSSSISDIEKNIETYSDRVLIGSLIASVFNNPFLDTDEILVESIQEIMDHVMSPVITSFTLWLIEEIKAQKCAGVILPSRDGYIIDKLLEIYQREKKDFSFKHEYFYTSRVACMSANIEDEESFKQVLRRPENKKNFETVEERIKLFIDKDLDDNEIYEKYKSSIHKMTAELNSSYKKYFKKLKIKKNQKYIFFDFVSAGTCLNYFNKMFLLNLSGKYFYRYNPEDKGKIHLNIDSFLDKEKGDFFWNYYKIFEAVITSKEGTFLGFDKKGNPLFESDLRTREELALVEEVQKNIKEYFRKIIKLEIDSCISKNLLMKLVELLDEKKFKIKNDQKNLIHLYDSLEAGKIKVFE